MLRLSPHGGPPTPLSSDFGSLRSNVFLLFPLPFWVSGFLGAWLIHVHSLFLVVALLVVGCCFLQQLCFIRIVPCIWSPKYSIYYLNYMCSVFNNSNIFPISQFIYLAQICSRTILCAQGLPVPEPRPAVPYTSETTWISRYMCQAHAQRVQQVASLRMVSYI